MFSAFHKPTDHPIKQDTQSFSDYENLPDELLDAMQTSLIFFDTKGFIIRINTLAREDLHITEDTVELKISDLFSVIHRNENILPNLIASFDTTELKQIKLPPNTFIRNKDKKVQFYVSGSLSQLKNGYYLFSFRNAMDEITREQILSMALMRAKIFPWFYDMQRQRMLIDAHWFSYLGIPAGDCTLSNEEFFERVHPDEREMLSQALENQLSNHEIQDSFTYRLRRGDGTWEWFDEQSMYLGQTESGSPYRIVGVCQSIQDHKTIEEDLRSARNKAQESDRLKSAFLANMSHEIRTPLNAIVGFSNLLMTCDNEAEKEEYNTIISTNNELLLRLINDILNLSKIEAGFIERKPEEFDLSLYFNELCSSVQQRMNNPQVKFICENPYPHCIVYMDKSRLTQVIMNYITNAIKYTPKGFIKMGYEQKDGGIKLFVSDSGIGISEKKKDRVYERFEKLDEFAQGTGLGLSISKALTELSGGQVGFESEEGVGSTFWSWIPTKVLFNEPKNEENIASTKRISSKTNISDMEKTTPKKILVAEDIESHFKLVSAFLHKQFDLTWALTGTEAVEKTQATQFDLILMDIKMPHMNGLEATRKIREFNKTIPIIALTAHAFDSDKEIALSAGCNDYLTKPLNKKALFEVLDRWIF